ncbi:MAG TPA: hypothetical protein VKQ72_02725 [Aggregatilineales bacterium]|nr:hypothetical protein [Aggregatilineales bacterium]
MSKQVGFYAINDDYRALLELAEKIGFLAIPAVKPTDIKIRPVRPTQFLLPEKVNIFCLMPGAFTEFESYYQAYPNGSSHLRRKISPVIDVSPCPREGIDIYNGRFYFQVNSDIPLYIEVLRGYEKLVRHIIKWTRTQPYRFYVGEYTAEAARTKQIRLMHFLTQLRLVTSE